MVDLDGVDYIGLVNNDATVEPGWLRALVDELEADASVGAEYHPATCLQRASI